MFTDFQCKHGNHFNVSCTFKVMHIFLGVSFAWIQTHLYNGIPNLWREVGSLRFHLQILLFCPNFQAQTDQGNGYTNVPIIILKTGHGSKNNLSPHTCLYLSLKAKLRACVGKYLITLARLPRQYERRPCSLGIRTKQSTIPGKRLRFFSPQTSNR